MATWKSGVCDCFKDSDICCYGFWCTPCLHGDNAEKIDGSNCFRSGCLWWFLSQCGFSCLVHMKKRKALRYRYHLREDYSDCLVTTFCASCAVCQEARELKFRSTSSRGSIPVVVQLIVKNTYSLIEQSEIIN